MTRHQLMLLISGVVVIADGIHIHKTHQKLKESKEINRELFLLNDWQSRRIGYMHDMLQRTDYELTEFDEIVLTDLLNEINSI